MLKIKLCGFNDKEMVDLAVDCGADFIGLVFHHQSPRAITPAKAAQITADLPQKVKKVAVLVDVSNQKLEEILENFRPDFWQIHNQENKKRISEIKNLYQIPIIKTISIASVADLAQIEEYREVADLFLFDSKTSEKGGSGKVFDWHILENLSAFNLKQNWFLSGGLNIDNVEQALKITGANMIDLSSGIEEKRGIKSAKLIRTFMEQCRDWRKI